MANLSLQKVLDIAVAEIGYFEKESNYKLYEKTANRGNKNYTKYNYELVQKIGYPYYNPAEWCDMFVDWCICTALNWDIEAAKNALFGFSAYCPTSAAYYRNKNRWYNKPSVGAQFFIGSKYHEEHTGLVYKVLSNSTFLSIEGNKGNCVCSIVRYNSACAGFGVPYYDNYNLEERVLIDTTEVKYGDSGKNVKTIQRIYNSYYKEEAINKELEVDGICGSMTELAIKELQKVLGLKADGVCGEDTWNGIINNL